MIPTNTRIQSIIRESIDSFEEEQQEPRILVLGATGAGKSSLVNALTGGTRCAVTHVASTTRHFQPERYELTNGDAIVVVDSPGYGEAGTDREYRDDLAQEAQSAHAVLLVLKADCKGYAQDLEVLGRVVRDPNFNRDRPVLVVLNQVDKLKPSREWEPPYRTEGAAREGDSPKQQRVLEKLGLVRKQLAEIMAGRPFALTATMADPDEGETFGVDELKLALFDVMPDVVRYRFARMVDLAATRSAELIARIDAEAESICRQGAAEAAGVVALNPIPLSDFIVLVPVQLRMVARIGSVYGRKFDEDTAMELLAVLGAGLGARTAFQALLSFIPGFKQVIGAAYASASTYGFGCAAKAWFRHGQVPGIEDLRFFVASRLEQPRLDQ